MKKLLVLLLLVTSSCASAPKSQKYRGLCLYPSVDCANGGACSLRDPRLAEISDYCMPIEVIEALDLVGYR